MKTIERAALRIGEHARLPAGTSSLGRGGVAGVERAVLGDDKSDVLRRAAKKLAARGKLGHAAQLLVRTLKAKAGPRPSGIEYRLLFHELDELRDLADDFESARRHSSRR